MANIEITRVLIQEQIPQTYCVELPPHDAQLFRIFLRGLEVKFNSSGCYKNTFFSFDLPPKSKQLTLITAFLKALD